MPYALFQEIVNVENASVLKEASILSSCIVRSSTWKSSSFTEFVNNGSFLCNICIRIHLEGGFITAAKYLLNYNPIFDLYKMLNFKTLFYFRKIFNTRKFFNSNIYLDSRARFYFNTMRVYN